MNTRFACWVLFGLASAGLVTGESGPKHWSLQPLASSEPPEVRARDWVRTPVDRFILRRLEDQGMEPAPPADRRTLLRRAYFNLTGLPPSPGDAAAFAADPSPSAFERVIDRLLERPEYGERWARHWLDVAHYAETHGHDQDRPRTNAWPYRDYVIQSFNSDKPYARFIEEQIAGDTLYPDDPQATVAMGFLATGPWDESSLRDIREDTIDRQIARYIDRDDIVTTVMNTFVSTTVQCARCHDHKFDPVSQREYYNLQAVFAGTDKANRFYDTDPKIHVERAGLLKRKRQLEFESALFTEELLSAESARRQSAWEESARQISSLWQILQPESAASSRGASVKIQKDGSILSAGTRPETDTLTVIAPAGGLGITGLRLEVLTDDSLPKKGPGRQENGNFHLTDLRVLAVRSDTSTQEIPIANASADYNQDGWGIAGAIDDDPATGWGIFPAVGKPHHAVFEFASPVYGAEQLQVTLAQNHGGGHLIGRARLSATTSAPPLAVSPFPEEIVRLLHTPAADRSREQQLALALFWAKEETEQVLKRLPEPRMVYAGAHYFPPDASFKPAGKPREVRLLKRGDIHKPGEPAAPGALESVAGLRAEFSPAAEEGERRAALARWIANPGNVLTWRSVVNRVWHYHFGRGLVNTPNDFGKMGGQPTHPELLDWLTGWFIEHGGSFKKLHKLIMTSAVYQQSSRGHPAHAAADAENTLLWRMNRTRLDAESVRDAILQISGTLDPRMGGPSAQQFLMSPGIHVTPKVDYAGFETDRPEMRRRSIYRFIFRTLPDPFMDSLDCPDSSQLTPARNTSVTPSQALAMLNDQFTTRYSEHFAARLESTHPENLDQQIGLAVELCFSREARPDELESFVPFVRKNGLANFCRVLFNSNEFMFIN